MRSRVFKLICLLAALVVIGGYFYEHGVIKLFRFGSPEEAFQKTAPWGAKVVDIVEDKGIALVFYDTDNGFTRVQSWSEKDERGWTSLSSEKTSQKEILQNNIRINYYEVQGKYCLVIEVRRKFSEDYPVISDSLNSKIGVSRMNFDDGTELISALVVSEVMFPNNYEVYCNNESINLKN